MGGRAESRDPREPGGGREVQKYAVLGEVAALTPSSHWESVQALSWNCILFRLDRAALHRALRPTPKINADERFSPLGKAILYKMMES